MAKILFPHDSIRPIQTEMISTIATAVDESKDVVIHAPTGLGKTAGSISPVLAKALDEGKKIFFLTSKNTQHRIAIETLQKIKEKHNIPIKGTDFVGKKWMCIQPGVSILKTGEFNEYCKAMREDKKCEFFTNLKEGEELSPTTKYTLHELTTKSPVTVETIIEHGRESKLCPYELAMLLAKESNVIITDYYYLFHPKIRDNFLTKNNIDLEQTIIIIDEGHNLPDRIKDLATTRISTLILKRAHAECIKYNHEQLATIFEKIAKILTYLITQNEYEKYVSREEIITRIEELIPYENLLKQCEIASKSIREEQKQSSIGSVGEFFDSWLGTDEGFTRIISKEKLLNKENIVLSYRCLDPSIVSKEVFSKAHSTILMSGTLTPTEMYTKLLGFDATTIQKTLPSPFPDENRLNLIIGKTSTKFTTRSEEQFKEIAEIVTNIINITPGNSAIFFPSYFFKDKVSIYLNKVEKTAFHEHQNLDKNEKEEMIQTFRSYKKTGACLLAVMGGSFGEGIDLPGDELKTVVVIGLPLGKPDLETKALIEYYDSKFKNGWDFGYVYPAFNKIIQSAGRCIRSNTDKGVIVFLDERFTWPRYFKCFPETWKMKVSVNRYDEQIKKFFDNT